MRHRQRRHMVMRTVEMAIWHRQGAASVILHSDRGGQFTSDDYQKLLKQSDLVSSMSAIGHCGDNAACEGGLRCTQEGKNTSRPLPDSQ